jgi:hypothetical protein
MVLQSNKSFNLQAVLAWTGFSLAILFLMTKPLIGFGEYCGQSIFIGLSAITIGLCKGLSFVENKLISILSLAFSIGAVLFVPLPYGLPVFVICISIAFIPDISASVRNIFAGSVLGIVLSRVIIQFDYQNEMAAFLICVIGILYFWKRFINPDVAPTEGKVTGHLSWMEILFIVLQVLLVCTFLLTLAGIPAYTSDYVYAGSIAGIIAAWGMHVWICKLRERLKFSHYITLYFYSAFLLTIFMGFFSRSFGIWSVFLLVMIGICLGTGIASARLIHEGLHFSDRPKSARKNFKVKMISFVIFLFVLGHFPSCLYWMDRIVEVSLPENVIPLATGQFFIKNLVLIPALATLIAGFLFVNRRRVQKPF